MNMPARPVEAELMEGHEVSAPDQALVQAITKAEIDQAITTARAFPRSIKSFLNEARSLVTLDKDVAGECVYALPRDGKTIIGPSARFAEALMYSWGNCRGGARVVEEGREFVRAQGIFHDLEKNVHVTFEVARRIVGKNGRRYSADMIGVTGNAASSIALRNAVLKGVPKALWSPLFREAQRTIAGTVQTLAARRAEAMAALEKLGAKRANIFATLGVKGIEDIGLDELTVLAGIFTAINDGDTTVEQAFAPPEEERGPSNRADQARDALAKRTGGATEQKDEPVPVYSEETAIMTLRGCKSLQDLSAKWVEVSQDFKGTSRPTPNNVHAAYIETKEALEQAKGEL